MRLLLKHNGLFHTTIKFLLCGCVCTGTDFIIYLTLLWLGCTSVGAKLVSTSLAMILSFVLNRNFTFQFQGTTDLQLILRFLFSQAVNLVTNVGINTLVLIWFHSVCIAFICATAGGMTVNYVFQRIFVFRRERM